MRTTYILGGVDRSREVVTKDDSPRYAFPDALPREEALREEAQCGHLVNDRLADVDFEVTHALAPGTLADTAAVGAWISEVVREYVPNATFLFGERGETPLLGRIKSAYVAAHENHGRQGWGFVTIKGTRFGPWEGTRVPARDAAGLEILDYPMSFPGVAHVRNTPGEMPGRLTTKLTADGGTDRFGVGIQPVTIPQTFGEEWDALDTGIWADGMVWGHSDADTRYKAEQRTCTSGILTLKGEKLDVPESGMHYKSGMVRSLQMFGPGQYLEFRGRPRHGDGWLSAVWFSNDDCSVEIDIEFPVGNGNPNTMVNFAVHNHPVGGADPAGTISFPYTHTESLQLAKHTYGVDWQKDGIRFYFDGRLVDTYRDNLIPTTALSIYGTLKGGDAWTGAVNDAQLPAYFDVDYVRVYPYCYDPSADFGDDDDSAARGDHANAQTLTGTYAEVGAIPLADANRFRGKYLPVARVKAPVGTFARFDSNVTGSGIAVTGHAWGQGIKTTAPSGSYSLEPAPLLEVPGVPVPGVETGSGYSDEGVLASQTDYSTMILHTPTAYGAAFPLIDGTRVSAIEVYIPDDAALILPGATVALYPLGISTPVPGTQSLVTSAAGVVSVELAAIPLAGGSYRVGVTNAEEIGASATGAMYFRVIGSSPLGFTSEVALEMKGTGTGSLDFAQLLPGAFCETIDGTFTAGQGALIDNSPADPGDRRVYITAETAGVAGPASGISRQTHGSSGLALPAGDSEVCVAANTDSNGKLSLWVTPLYATRGGA